MAVMEQDRFWFRGAGRCSKSWSNVRPVMYGADAPRVSSGVSRWMVAVSFLTAFRTCPAGLVVGHVRRRMDRHDALQQPAGPVEAGQGFRMVGSGVVRDDRDLAGAGFALEPVQREGRLPGVPVLLGRVRRDCSAGRGGRRRRTGTSSAGPRTVWCAALSGAACGGSRPRAPSGRARMASSSCFRTRTGSTASRFPACPAGTQHILVPRQSAGHSCTVLSARSTIPAMTPASTPREACRTAPAFIPASTRLPERLLHPTRTAVSSGATPTRTPHRIRNSTGNPRNTAPSHDGHKPGLAALFHYGHTSPAASSRPTCSDPTLLCDESFKFQ